MKYLKFRKVFMTPVFVCLGVVATFAATVDAPQKEVELDDKEIRETTVQKVLLERKKRIEKLIEIVDPANKKKHSKKKRSKAAYLLGEMRAIEAVPVLVKSLSIADNPGPSIIISMSRYDAPITTALIKIGRPAVLAMIRNMETSDNLSVRINSRFVLYHTVGGSRRVLEILKRRLNEAKDPKIKARLKRACDKLADDISKFKPDKDYKEPLF